VLLFYPGSFDPFHRGHLDLIRRAAPLCASLVVGIGVNPAKQAMLPIEERLAAVTAELAGIPGVAVAAYSGSTLAEAHRLGAQSLLRGLRSLADLEAEATMAAIHRSHGLETLFLLTDGRFAHISSSAVRLALSARLSINELVPPAVERALERRRAP
jgi:pantetheine-phosphate adenylyltransferase